MEMEMKNEARRRPNRDIEDDAGERPPLLINELLTTRYGGLGKHGPLDMVTALNPSKLFAHFNVKNAHPGVRRTSESFDSDRHTETGWPDSG